ncbi:MAG: hypothetical protein IT336_12360 [Thermomicrobiales bacterium]|nr:hypothetical protein [Thermomicrobiales bacterium]
MRLLGEIVRLQAQAESLKVGEAPRRRYDPAGIRVVPRLRLSAEGVAGETGDGQLVADVHNSTHPASKNRAGSNGISVCFTTHYGAIRERFGDHLPDGIAGENILVALDPKSGLIVEDDLRGGLTIETASGGRIVLEQVFVAAPCVEFARFAMRFPQDARPDRSVTEAVQFLDDGMRGYYAAYQGPSAVISIGDKVYVD